MGAGASACITACINEASEEEIKTMLAKCSEADRKKIEGMMTPKPGTAIKIHGMTVSANCMGPVLFAMEAGVGCLETCDLMKGDHMKPEFLAMNPYHQVPTMKDGSIAIGESNAILRYLAMAYKKECYPVDDPVLCGIIDFALDTITNYVYPKFKDIVYPVLGFAPAPEDQAAANKAYTEVLEMWATHFLKGKFVVGDKLTIADFKAVSYLFPSSLPGVHSKVGFKLPDRLMQYVDDFCDVVKSSSLFKEAGGFSIAEFIAMKVPDEGTTGKPEYKKVEYSVSPTPKTAGKDIKVFAITLSAPSAGAIMLSTDVGVGGMETTDLMNGAHLKPEFLAMNPFHHIPVVKDGDFAIGESSACMRYLALQYKPAYYPKSDPAACAWIDFAMDSFSSQVYPHYVKVVHPVMGFSKAPEDQVAANKAFTEAIETWAKFFLKGDFVGVEVCIADFKVIPFFFAAAHPTLEKNVDFKVPARINKYIEDFCKAIPSSKMLKDAGGVGEYLASKAA